MFRKSKILSFLLCFCLLFEQAGFAQVVGTLDISGQIAVFRGFLVQDKFRPLHLRSLGYDNRQNSFKVSLDKGDIKNPRKLELETTTKDLLNYFFVGITLPNDAFWVNLKPDSENNIVDSDLATTDVGRILLEADLQLKKDTAKFISPETPIGKEYWKKLYQKAGELFGYENITIPTLTRPWIVPGEIIIRETKDNAYIYKATFKVMLEQDYLKDSVAYNFDDSRLKILNEYSAQLMRELVIPKLTKEINISLRYAPLRQVYYSLILAQWFKSRFYGKSGLYSWLIDRRNLRGLVSKVPWDKSTYFKAYQKSFNDGEYNIRQPVSTLYGQTIRSYFSGGFVCNVPMPVVPAPGVAVERIDGPTKVTAISGDLEHHPLTGSENIIGALAIGGNTMDPAAVEVTITEEASSSSGLPAGGLQSGASSKKINESNARIEEEPAEDGSAKTPSWVQRTGKKITLTVLGAAQLFGLSGDSNSKGRNLDTPDSSQPNAQIVAPPVTERIVRTEEAVRSHARTDPWTVLDTLDEYINQPWAEEVIRSVVAAAPAVALKHADKYIKQPYGKEVLEKAARAAAKSDARGAVEYADKYIDQPWAKEVFMPAARMVSQVALQYADNYIKQPYGNEVLEEAARYAAENYHPEEALKYADKYINQPWAEEVIKLAAEKAPTAALQYADNYIKQFYGNEVLEKAARAAAKSDPRGAVGYVDKYINQPWAEKVLRSAAEKVPVTALEFADKYIGQSYGNEVLEKVARATVEEAPEAVLQHADKYINQPWVEEVIRRAAGKSSGAALQYCYKYINQPWAEEVIKSATEKSPEIALEYALQYVHKSYGKEVLERAARATVESSPWAALEHSDRYINQPYGKELLERAARTVAKNLPLIAFRYVDKYIDQSWAEEVIKSAAESGPWIALEYASRYIKKSWAEEVIKSAAERAPAGALQYCGKYIDQPWADVVIKSAAEKAPHAALEYFSLIKNIIEKSSTPTLKGIQAIHNSAYLLGRKKIIAALLEAIVNQGMSLEEADRVSRNDGEFFNALVRIVAKPDHLGSAHIELILADISLRNIRRINDLHLSPDSVRFESVKNASAKELYILMVYGEEEIFTSSFNGLFARLMKQLKEEKLSGNQLFDDLGYNKFRSFIKLLANYQRLNEFLGTLPFLERQSLLVKFIQGIDREKNMLEQAVVVADTFGSLKDEDIIKLMQETIRVEYKRLESGGNKQALEIYGLLAGMFSEKASTDEAWFKQMADKYRLSSVTGISSRRLFENGVNIQQYFFYNDADGQSSFSNFLNQYKNDPSWNVKDRGNYVLVSSKDNKIEIYANLPDKEFQGREEISKLLKVRKVSPTVYVHRGHSYHLGKTVSEITSSAAVVYLGSCGGYVSMSSVLDRSPSAHILSTKGTGTMTVNDLLLKMLNEQIRKGGGIDWFIFWSAAENKLGNNGDFLKYVPPHKNLGALFIKAYYQRLKESSLPREAGGQTSSLLRGEGQNSNTFAFTIAASPEQSQLVIHHANLGAQVSNIKYLDFFLRLINVLRRSENVPEVPEGALDREIVEFCIKYLETKDLITAKMDEDRNIVIDINNNVVNHPDEAVRRFVAAVRRRVINPKEGAKVINFQTKEGVWMIVGFESELQNKDTLEHEQQEIRFRKQGLSWTEAHNQVVAEIGKGRMIDQEARDATGNLVSVEQKDKVGGIDFRALPMVSQPASTARLKLNAADLSRLNNINLDLEWAQIQNMVNAGIIPSNERIREYVLASCLKQSFTLEMNKVLGCIADVMRLEEDRVSDSDAGLKNLLALIESGKPDNELQFDLSRLNPSSLEFRLSA